MSSLRILHASPTWFSPESVVGGGERWVHNVIEALGVGAPHHRQAMVAIGRKPSAQLSGKTFIRVLANERKLQSPMDAISSQLWNEFSNFDVIHIHQSLTDFGAYASCVAASMNKTVVMTDLGGGSNPIMMHGGLKLADGIISISEYAHGMIRAALGNCPTEIMIGPIDTNTFRPSETPPTKPAAICVSRIMPHKGIDRLIRALPKQLKLRVVGKVYNSEYRDLLAQLSIGKNVEFIHDATDNDLADLYRKSTLFLQASCIQDVYGNIEPKTELMGLTTMEAMASGLAVIVSADGGSLPELVTDARFGMIFRTETELADMLSQHLHGMWPLNDSTRAAREHAVAQHGMKAYGQRLGKFYSSVHQRRLEGKCAS